MLRALVLLLLLANAFFFAWTRGWLAPMLEVPTHGQRTPERLAQQVRPETITLLGAKAASAAISAARAASMAAGEGEECLEAGPFAAAEVGAAEGLLVQASQGSEPWARREERRPAAWAAYLGPFPNVEAQRRRSDELRKLNIAAQPVNEPAELSGGLLLGRYESREAAEAALPAWAERGARNARAAMLTAGGSEQWLRLERGSAALRQQLKGIDFGTRAAVGVCRTAR